MTRRTLWLIVILIIGIVLMAFLTVAWYFIIPPLYDIESIDETGLELIPSLFPNGSVISPSLASGEERMILALTQKADFHYSLNFSITSNLTSIEFLELKVHVDGNEWAGNGISVPEEFSGSLSPMFIGARNATVLVNATNESPDYASIDLAWNFTTQHRASSSISTLLLLTSFALIFFDVIAVVVIGLSSLYGRAKSSLRK